VALQVMATSKDKGLSQMCSSQKTVPVSEDQARLLPAPPSIRENQPNSSQTGCCFELFDGWHFRHEESVTNKPAIPLAEMIAPPL
jgi:hypothetical protein